jgi:hypothetical protein
MKLGDELLAAATAALHARDREIARLKRTIEELKRRIEELERGQEAQP